MRTLSSTVHVLLTTAGQSRGVPWKPVAAVLAAVVVAGVTFVLALDWVDEPGPRVEPVRLEVPAEGFDRLGTTTTTSTTAPPLEVVPPPVSLEPAPPPPPPPADDDDDDIDDDIDDDDGEEDD